MKTAVQYLNTQADPSLHAGDRATRAQVAYGILWADQSARIDGTLAVRSTHEGG